MATDPWERQPYDTDESWTLFQAFRDQTAPRQGLYVMLRGRPVDPVKVARWYRDHYWAERVAEYDRHCDTIIRVEREGLLAKSAREAMADHIALLEQSKEIAIREFSKLLQTVKESSVEVVKPRELIALTEMTIKLGRLIRGETTENVQMEGPDLSHLSNEQLAELDKLLEDKNAPAIH